MLGWLMYHLCGHLHNSIACYCVLFIGQMKVLIACEESGIVREAFKAKGHDAWSCDLLDTEIPGQHIKRDVLEILDDGWDLMIAFPPCTHLSSSGARWFDEKRKDGRQQKGIDFFMRLVNSGIDKVCIENPIGIMSTLHRKPNQIIQPWQHGHGETKATCLWLKNLPKLKPTNIVKGRDQRIWKMSPGENRSKERSKTFQGIANAFANQYG